jgi:predicted RNA-binding Zn ribbon-like protein
MTGYHVVMPQTAPTPLQAPWSGLGGRPSLDLVNTLRDRRAERRETLRAPGDLGAWLAAAGLMDEVVLPRRVMLDEALELREAIDAVVTAVVEGAPVPAAGVTRIDDWLVHAGRRPQLTLGPGGAPVLGERAPADSPRRALGTIALDAATMLGTDQRSRIRICASETCSGRFFDRSPAGRRRWCSMRTCGNEAKARRHRLRLRAGA